MALSARERFDPQSCDSPDDSDLHDVANAEAAWRSGSAMPRPLLDIGSNRTLGNASSLAFNGPDLRRLYIGTLLRTWIAVEQASVASAPPPDWRV